MKCISFFITVIYFSNTFIQVILLKFDHKKQFAIDKGICI